MAYSSSDLNLCFAGVYRALELILVWHVERPSALSVSLELCLPDVSRVLEPDN